MVRSLAPGVFHRVRPPKVRATPPWRGPSLQPGASRAGAPGCKDEVAEGGLSQEGGLVLSPGGAQRLAPRPAQARSASRTPCAPARAERSAAVRVPRRRRPAVSPATGRLRPPGRGAPAPPRGAPGAGAGPVRRSRPPADGRALRPPRARSRLHALTGMGRNRLTRTNRPPHSYPGGPGGQACGRRPAAPRARPVTAGVQTRAPGHVRLAAPRHRPRQPRLLSEPLPQRAERSDNASFAERSRPPPASRLSGPQEKPQSPPHYPRNPILKRALRAVACLPSRERPGPLWPMTGRSWPPRPPPVSRTRAPRAGYQPTPRRLLGGRRASTDRGGNARSAGSQRGSAGVSQGRTLGSPCI